MMSAIIAFACANMTTTNIKYREGCEKAFEAGALHTGLWMKADRFAAQMEKEARKRVSEETALVGTAAYTLFVSQEARLSSKHVPYVDSSVLIIKPKTVSVIFSWRME